VGIYQYKFQVDSEWRYRDDLPIFKNEDNSINNIIQALPGKQINFQFENEYLLDIPIAVLHYLVYVPLEYPNTVITNSKEWPLILYLHGSDCCGNQTELLKKNGLCKYLEEKHIPFVVISPQCSEDYLYLQHSDILIDLLYHILDKYKIDRQRLYVIGFENGARTALKLSRKYSYLLTAVALVSGNYQLTDIEVTEDSDEITPLKIYHYRHDGSINIIERLKKKLDDKTPNPIVINVQESMTKFDYGTETMLKQEIFEWLLKHVSKRELE